MKVEEYLKNKIKRRGAIHLTLIDPDKAHNLDIDEVCSEVEEAGTSAILVGGSLGVIGGELDNLVKKIKENVTIPVILFPGGVEGISPYADAILFMSLLNSRNPYFITGAQARGAYIVKKYGLEAIPMAYIIIGGGEAAGYMGEANPIPRTRPEIAIAYALAGQYLGSHFIYLEAGSGAKEPIDKRIISMVKNAIEIPLIVGGGIKDAKNAAEVVAAGADCIVTGTLIEEEEEAGRKIELIVQAIEKAAKR